MRSCRQALPIGIASTETERILCNPLLLLPISLLSWWLLSNAIAKEKKSLFCQKHFYRSYSWQSSARREKRFCRCSNGERTGKLPCALLAA